MTKFGIVLPGTASASPLRQSFTSPNGWPISFGVSLPSGVMTRSSHAGKCSFASSENVLPISLNASQSLFDSHGGEIAALNGWTNGCMSVLERSNFSYHVAAGKTISENRPELVIRKSMLTNKSAFPRGGSPSVLIVSGCHELAVSVNTASSPPIKCLTKYSWPFPLSPNRFERQLKNTLGKLRGSSGFSMAHSSFSCFNCSTTYWMTSWSSFAPFSRASLTMSIEFFVNCGKEGSQPSLAARALTSAGCMFLKRPPQPSWLSLMRASYRYWSVTK
ncbi:hypothetical protein B4098_1739 [Heyndrickxia coagulans]|uniref:Uncharacterized protein n=1 Tax=Heyndrickxia coagulans TaxID=1398 RepID=A0A150JU31_HEYCO|nr:hypothetical protein B4098_1739 [Heyndrickxia coagulans]